MTIFEKANFLVERLDDINSILNNIGIYNYRIVTSKNILAFSEDYTELFIETNDSIDVDGKSMAIKSLNKLHQEMVYDIVEYGEAFGMIVGCVTLYRSDTKLKVPEARTISEMNIFN